MEARARLENEIRERCGDEFMQELVKEGELDRKGRIAEKGCMGFLLLVLFGILCVWPSTHVLRYATWYWGLSDGVPVVAHVTEIDPEKPDVLHYKFEADGKERKGRSILPREEAAGYRIGDPLQVLHDPRTPSRSRAVDASGPASAGMFALPGWIIVGLLSAFLAFTFWKKRRGTTPRNLPWFEYATTTPDPSPRAWTQAALGRGDVAAGGAIALFSASSLDPWDLLCEQSEALTEWEWFKKTARSLDVPSCLLRAKYAERWFHGYDGPAPVPHVAIPRSLDAVDGEIDSFPFTPLLGHLVNNGTAEEPEVDVVDLDLAGLDHDGTVAQFVQASVAEEAATEEEFDAAGREKAREKAWSEARWGEASFALERRLAGTGAVVDAKHMEAVEALLLVRGLLYWFFATPWRTEAFDSEMPTRRMDGRIVLLRLQFEPGSRLRLVRRHNPGKAGTDGTAP